MAKSQSLAMAVRNCDDSVQILLWILFNFTCTHVRPRGSPHTAGFLIGNVQHIEYLRYTFRGAPPTYFRADSVTINTPHTTGNSDKIIFRSTKIIGTRGVIAGYLMIRYNHDTLLTITIISR